MSLVFTLFMMTGLAQAQIKDQWSPENWGELLNFNLTPRYSCSALAGEVAKATAENPYASCIETICGPNPANLQTANENYQFLTAPIAKIMMEREIGPALKQLFRTQRNNLQDWAQGLDAREQTELKKQIYLDQLLDQYARDKYLIALEHLEAGTLSPAATPSEMMDVVAADLNAQYSAELTKALEQKLWQVNDAFEAANYYVRTQSAPELNHLINKEQIVEATWRLPSAVGKEKFTILNSLAELDNEETLAPGSHVSAPQAELTLEQARTTYLLAQNLIERRELLAAQDQLILNALPAGEIETFDPAAFLTAGLEGVQESCLLGMEEMLKSLPSAKDKERAERQIEARKEEIIKEMQRQRLFSLSSQRHLGGVIRAIEVKLPPTKLEYARSVGSHFKNIANFSARLSKSDQIMQTHALVSQQGCPVSSSYDRNMAYYHDPAHNHEFIYLDSSAIHNFEAIGAPVLAHELGHTLSVHLKGSGISSESRAQKSRVSSCVARGHVNGSFLGKIFKRAPDDFIEEDFADSFAEQVSPTGPNLACALTLNGAPMGSDQGLGASAESLAADSAFSWKHSPVVFRLLHWQKNASGRIPAVCEEIMKARGENQSLPYRCWNDATAER